MTDQKNVEKTNYTTNISKEKAMRDVANICLQEFLKHVPVNHNQNDSTQYIVMKYCEIMNFVNNHFDFYSER
jgi:hypothetical protein